MDLKQLGKYEIIAKIGQGAMGEVFRAHDPILRRDVAIKTMSASVDTDEDLRKRFNREAQSAARLNHPNIITLFDFGEDHGVAYMAMELLTGSDLRSLIGSRSVTLDEKLNVMEQICEGLVFAHAMEVIHRDLKPANIHVQPSGQVKIMDFGLARLGSSEMTKTGMVMGTPNYMSPEQVRGEKVDVRSDLFSIGAVFYELLTAHKPFQADSMHAVLFQVLENDPEPPLRWVPTLPTILVDLVEKALRKDPAERFKNAGEMLDAVRQARQTVPFEVLSAALPLLDAASETVVGDGPSASDRTSGAETSVTAARRSRWTSIGSRATAAASDPNLRTAARPKPMPRTLSGKARTQVEAPPVPATRVAPQPSTSRAPLVAAGVGLMAVGGAVVWFLSHRGPSGATETVTPAVTLVAQPLPTPKETESSAPVAPPVPVSAPPTTEARSLAPPTTVAEKPPRSAPGTRTLRPQDDRIPAVTTAPAPTLEARPAPPTTEVAVTLPPPPPVTAAPVAAPPTTVTPPTTVVNEEAAIRKVIADYGRAIEEKNLALFKTLKPNLTGDEERRLREAFQIAASQTVRITIASVQISGSQATAHLTRQDTIDGRSQAFQQTLQLSKTPGGWTIREIGR